MTCSRPKCPNALYRNGFCRKHAEANPHGYFPASPVRDHLRRLRCRYDAITLEGITSLHGATLRNVASSRHELLEVRTAAAVLAITCPNRPVTGPGYLPAAGTARRIRALSAIGWEQKHLADCLGQTAPSIGHVLRIAGTTAVKAARIADLYDELALVAGPSSRARDISRAKGWPPPLAWDDETIDDPDTTPFDTTRNRRAEAAEDLAERRQVVHRMTAGGLSATEIAEQLGVSPRQVVRDRAALRTAS